MTSQRRIDTRFLISKIYLLSWMMKPFSPRQIWYGGITRFQWLMRTLLRLLSSLHLGCTNIYACLSDQRLTDTVFQNVSCVFVYFDDILIASTTVKQHICDIRTVCRRLNDSGLTIRLEKYTFGVKSINFLGHQITGEGLIPLRSKVHANTHHPKHRRIQDFIRGGPNFQKIVQKPGHPKLFFLNTHTHIYISIYIYIYIYIYINSLRRKTLN